MAAMGESISVEESKRRLLEWGDAADELMRQELHAAIETAKHGAIKALPWAALALVVGLLKGRGKRAEGGRGAGPIGRAIGMARTAIRVAMFVLPLIRPFLHKRARAE